MKKALILLFALLLVWWCQNTEAPSPEKLVKIIVQNGGITLSESTGYKIWTHTVLGSLHAVDNTHGSIYIRNEQYTIWEQESENDLVLLQKAWDTKYDTRETLQTLFQKPEKWEKVFAFVWRNGKAEKVEWHVLDIDTAVLGYMENGKAYHITAKVLTDIAFISGDSGAPIWNEKGELVDVVHIAK